MQTGFELLMKELKLQVSGPKYGLFSSVTLNYKVIPSFPSRQNPAGRIVPGGRGSSWLAVFNWCSDLDWPLPPVPGDLV